MPTRDRTAYYAANKEKIAVRSAARYVANKERILARQKQRRLEGSTYAKDYYAKNRTRINERDRAYNAANKEKRNAASRAYYAANKERLTEYSRAYYEANKHTDMWRESNKRAYANNKEAYRARDTRHKADVAKQYSALSDLEKWVLKEAHRLARLREKVCGGKWEVDHIVPLSKGGGHNPYNVQVVPQFFNRSKGAAHQARLFGAQE